MPKKITVWLHFIEVDHNKAISKSVSRIHHHLRITNKMENKSVCVVIAMCWYLDPSSR